MNQYQACLYLSESFFHCGSKYGHEIPQFLHFLHILLNFDLSSALACRVESINPLHSVHIPNNMSDLPVSTCITSQNIRY